MIASIGAAMAAGLLGSPHCAGMCGGFAGACGRTRDGLALWHAGRLTTYAVLGAAAGGFGAVLPGPAWVPALLSVMLLVWFALSLAGLAPEPAPRLAWVGRLGGALLGRRGRWPRFAFGALNGLLPCGMVYAALSIPLALGSPLAGAAAMVAFGLGTVPALTLFPALLAGFARRGLWHRRAIAVLVLVAGLVSISLRAAGGEPGAERGAAHVHGVSS